APKLVPALVKPTSIFVDPFLRHFMRFMRRARRKIEKIWLFRGERFVRLNPGDCMIDEVGCEVITLVRCFRGLNGSRIVIERRLPLTVVSTHVAVIMFES